MTVSPPPASPRLALTSVLVADEQPLFRDAVARTVRQRADLQLVGEHADGRSALVAIRELSPAVAVLEADLPELTGTAVARAALRDGLPTGVVLLAATMPAEAVYEALGAGVRGYLSKAASAAEVCDAIVRVARGGTVIAPAAQGGVALGIRLRAKGADPPLTPRERQILERISAGRTAPEIGRELHLATATVKTHMLHLYEKLEVSERAAAVAEGMRRGLIE